MPLFENLERQIAEILEIDPNHLHSDTILDGNESWDSFAMLSTVALITEYTGKQVTLDRISGLATVFDLITLFKKLKSD